MKRSGSCQCGHIQYEVNGEDLGFGVCYCTECQKLSAGSSSYTLIIHRQSFHLLQGTLKQWERMADSGNRNLASFCPECGNRIFHEIPESPDFIRVKAGTLSNAQELDPEFHLWTRSAPAWIKIPDGDLIYETQPPVDELLKHIKQRRSKSNW